jgi:hypothetical protein
VEKGKNRLVSNKAGLFSLIVVSAEMSIFLISNKFKYSARCWLKVYTWQMIGNY